MKPAKQERREIRTAPIGNALTIISFLCFATQIGAVDPQRPSASDKINDLKERILSQAQSLNPDDYAFTRTIKTDQTSRGEVEHHISIEKFDPTQPSQSRWTLVSINGGPPPADELKRYQSDSAKRRVPGYYRLAGYFGAESTNSTDSQGRTVFRFNDLPKGTVTVFDTDVSQKATVDAAVAGTNDAPFVEEVRLTVTPMRIKLIAKLNKYESVGRYSIGPEGKPLLMEQTSDMSGSGFGQEGSAHTVVTYSDYRFLGKKTGAN